MKHWNKYLRFSFVAILIQILIVLIGLLLSRFAGVDIGNGTTIVVTPLASGLMVAQWDFENGVWDPTKGQMWREALSVGSVGFAVSIILGALGVLALGAADIFTILGPVGWIVILVITGVLFVLMTRVGMGMGVRSARKAAELKK